ncbi:M23 family metallopeptidase [Glutamicibacter ardleyensis]|uniref:M23 family metallopeptidase n=1 Tax=Glutamicibacter ardleyensis TaxID=225894 RepID=UPI003FD08A6F
MIQLLARTRRPLFSLGLLIIFGSVAWGITNRIITGEPRISWWVVVFACICIIYGLAATAFSPVSRSPKLKLSSPVLGHWFVVNSPSSKIPSHGTHGYGQAFAADFVLHSTDSNLEPTNPRSLRGFKRPEEFPSFGMPILAPAQGVIVKVSGGNRDHRSRTSFLALLYFYLESIFRDLMGTKQMLGNHIVMRLADESHFVFAHLRRDSSRVTIGQNVGAGEVIGECGNSGNSTEPHLHCQRQDIASPAYAVGLPWSIESTGIPENYGFIDDPTREFSGR